MEIQDLHYDQNLNTIPYESGKETNEPRLCLYTTLNCLLPTEEHIWIAHH
jgi:hypothetical protein